MPEPAPERPQLKPFGQFLHEQRSGLLHDELSETLAELVTACVETGKKGTLTLKVDVKPTKDGVTLLLTDDVKTTLPKHDAKPALFFYDEHGNLLRKDPRQMDLDLKELPGGKAAEQVRQLDSKEKGA
jgi:hypothetical protein